MAKEKLDAGYVIEDDIKVPRIRKSDSLWNLAEKMKEGQSVLLADKKEAIKFRYRLKGLGFKSIARVMDGSVRVWKGSEVQE